MRIQISFAVLTAACMACAAALAWPDTDSPAPYTNSIGIPLPPDAAPPEYQVFTSFKAENRYLDMATSHYQVIGHDYALVNEPLVRMDRNYNLLPGAAARWQCPTTVGPGLFICSPTWFSPTAIR